MTIAHMPRHLARHICTRSIPPYPVKGYAVTVCCLREESFRKTTVSNSIFFLWKFFFFFVGPCEAA
jgi:hypothetical protein